MTAEKRRAHARIETDIPCTVDGRTEGRIRNLSVGAALLLAPAGFAELDETVSLEFQVGEVELVDVLGEVLRIAPREADTDAEYGIQFVAVEPADRVRLARCLDLLVSGNGVGRREAPRLYRRVDLRCQAAREFYGTMENISRGGLGLECEVPLMVGEEVGLEVLVGSLDAPFKLSGVVTHVRPGPGELFRVGLRFGSMSAQQRTNLEQMLQSVLR